MFTNSVSNVKLHYCIAALILFILIFLTLPLLLFHLNNNYLERSHTCRRSAKSSQFENCDEVNFGTQLVIPNTPTVNCTRFQLETHLSLGKIVNFHCTDGYFPCNACPFICIKRELQCDGHADCPDKSDESSCHDGHGAYKSILGQIFNNRNLSSNFSYAQPESCPDELFDKEQCGCDLYDPKVIICTDQKLTSIPVDKFKSSVYKILLIKNLIEDIDNVKWPLDLSNLVLANNRITHISGSTFELAYNLSKLYLNNNEIVTIDRKAFAKTPKLTSLHLESNKLRSFDTKILLNTPEINKLYLSENMIELHEDTQFGHCQNLKELLLDHNKISLVRSHWFSNLTKLIWLSLSHNEISYIEEGSFESNTALLDLNLSFNKITSIHRNMFATSLNIQRLHLGSNPLRTLPMDAFREITKLKSLSLADVEFKLIHNGTFSYLTDLKFIYFAKFLYCHYATHVRVCRPLTDGLSSSKELLAFPIQKYAVWIVASICCLGNVLVFIWRSISKHEDRTLSLFVRNLSLADLMMGVYLGAIGWKDLEFQRNFSSHAIKWMSSRTCTAIGVLAMLSSELSVFILTIITIERYRAIISKSNSDYQTQEHRAKIYVLLAWLFALLIAFYPLVEGLIRRSDYYATNGLCLPLYIDQPWNHGWKYSAIIYIGINLTALLIIIWLYVLMYSMIMNTRKVVRPVIFKAEKREDAILAIRFFFIVLTDCLCWIPIVVIKILALFDVNISSSIYGWLVVFVIPINSALNPVVYTLAAPTSLRSTVFRLFERLCYKIDLPPKNGSNYSSHSSTTGSGTLDVNTTTSGNKRRANTGSISTTCDTYDTSLASHSKASVESALIHANRYSIVTNSRLSSSKSLKALDDNSIDKYDSDLNNRIYHPYHYPQPTAPPPYDCLSTYEDNATITHRIINNPKSDLYGSQHSIKYRNPTGRSLTDYDPSIDERRTSFCRSQTETCKYNGIEADHMRRLTIAGYADEDNVYRHYQLGKVIMQVGVHSTNELNDNIHDSDDKMSTRQTELMEKSYNFPTNCTTSATNMTKNDSNISSQTTNSSRSNRVSFGSKDSHTCLLGGHNNHS